MTGLKGGDLASYDPALKIKKFSNYMFDNS